MKKTCFKCNQELDISEFYAHPMMADGHLGKCKECTKKDVAENYRNRKPQYAAYEKQRFQRPDRKEASIEYQRTRRIRSPDKYKANSAVGNAVRDGRLIKKPCEVCGTEEKVEAHHEDYSKPLDVMWLCFKHHRERHGQEVLDQLNSELDMNENSPELN